MTSRCSVPSDAVNSGEQRADATTRPNRPANDRVLPKRGGMANHEIDPRRGRRNDVTPQGFCLQDSHLLGFYVIGSSPLSRTPNDRLSPSPARGRPRGRVVRRRRALRPPNRPSARTRPRRGRRPRTPPRRTASSRSSASTSKTAPRPKAPTPVATTLPLELEAGRPYRVHRQHAASSGRRSSAISRRCCSSVSAASSWSSATSPGRRTRSDLQPRPANFADTEQHLTHEKVGRDLRGVRVQRVVRRRGGAPAFRKQLAEFVAGPEDEGVQRQDGAADRAGVADRQREHAGRAAADLNNERHRSSTSTAMREVAARAASRLRRCLHADARRRCASPART